MMTCIMASARAISLPGLMKKCLSPAAPVRLRYGSMVYSFAPLRRASMTKGHRWTLVPRMQQELAKIAELRDLGYEEPLHYPTANVNVNRGKAGQRGTTAHKIGQAGVFT